MPQPQNQNTFVLTPETAEAMGLKLGPNGYEKVVAPQASARGPVAPTLRQTIAAQAAPEPSRFPDELPADFETHFVPPQQAAAPTAPAANVSAAALSAQAGQPLVQEKRVTLQMPITDPAGKVWTEVVLRRPKWPAFERCLADHRIQSGDMTHQTAIIAACIGVPMDFMEDLDLIDGMRILQEIQGFFPQGLQVSDSTITPK